MAQGRDATDVALTTSFGRAPLTRFEVHTNEVRTTDLTRSPRETAAALERGRSASLIGQA
jgi:hypothetical protein